MASKSNLFYSLSNLPKIRKQDLSNEIVKKYDMKINKDGSMSVQISEKYNQVDYIQSFRKQCDIYEIIKRFENGDNSALLHNPGFYGDLSYMPGDLIEVNAVLDRFNSMYNTLDKSKLQKEFNVNNLKDFINGLFDGRFINNNNVIKDNKDIDLDTSKVNKDTPETPKDK